MKSDRASQNEFDSIFGDADLHALIGRTPKGRAAYEEARMRRQFARVFEEARAAKGLSLAGLARDMGTSVSQVQRVLGKLVGGTVTLRTLLRAADVLDVRISYNARQRSAEGRRRGGGQIAPVQPDAVRDD